MAGASDRWQDLRPRLISAAVMIAVGVVEIVLGGWPFLVLVGALISLMIWELAAMTGRPQGGRMAVGIALLAALAILFDEGWPSVPSWWVFPFVIGAILVTPRIQPIASAAIAAAILVGGHGLFVLRDEAGTPAILWLIGVVIASDVMGYFVGRIVGGPKFWPAISPKKTWSGTIAGWFGALVVGVGFVLAGQGEPLLIILSPIVAFAGQMGDIAESWIKRRAGVKDSSHLIPGHGGVMDRFDALTGAMVAVMILGRLIDLPVGFGG
jgi:phosphatidate cytidylyltransferase